MLEKRIKIIEWLDSIEKDYDVTKLKVEDIHYWPALRWVLTKKFIEYEKIKTSNRKRVNYKFSLKKIHDFLWGGFQFVLLKLKLIGRYEIIFSAANSHYTEYKNKKVNKLLYPLSKIFNKNNIRILTADYSGFNSKESDTFNLEAAFNFYIKFKGGRQQPLQNPILKEIIAKYEQEFEVLFDWSGFNRKIGLILQWAEIYEMLIVACKPKWIFHVCYYNIQGYGLNLACFRQNVKSVEMQHGPQGILHPAYSGFNIIPDTGYSIMPKIFWCWDKVSTNHLKRIFETSSYHLVYKGGHPWMSFILEQSNKYKNFSDKKILLFSLQPLTPIIPQILMDSFEKTPVDYVWWVRLHPRMRTEDVANLNAKLRKYIEKGVIEIDKASTLALPEILAMTSVHITKSSGCFIEANMMGVPNIIIEELGALYYKEFIDNEKNLVQTEGNIWNSINILSQLRERKNEELNMEKNLNSLLKRY